MAHHEHDEVVVTPQPADKAHIRKIWMTALILGVVTAIEFLIAFTVDNATFRIAVFIGLTIVKAFYIVAEFMHMKYETKSLIWSILIPTIFIIWLIIALLVEGGEVLDARF
ncbi:cytochrome C oxidase subunit IV family protein [Cesiribacter andamanensis]|uniref:Putative small integral membrane protein n=1 Tax=Cesiribacter andamanensis AMV16 TaxID=1279009 RepID=M7N2X0_9BACT|nr:cytochrome C oxidase subunit IV family protein [Cesiribacter andamanensis]EMR03028.1 putative small integral membrane protein [Cesiribacter andamanensis AMV16]